MLTKTIFSLVLSLVILIAPVKALATKDVGIWYSTWYTKERTMIGQLALELGQPGNFLKMYLEMEKQMRLLQTVVVGIGTLQCQMVVSLALPLAGRKALELVLPKQFVADASGDGKADLITLILVQVTGMWLLLQEQV